MTVPDYTIIDFPTVPVTIPLYWSNTQILQLTEKTYRFPLPTFIVLGVIRT